MTIYAVDYYLHCITIIYQSPSVAWTHSNCVSLLLNLITWLPPCMNRMDKQSVIP